MYIEGDGDFGVRRGYGESMGHCVKSEVGYQVLSPGCIRLKWGVVITRVIKVAAPDRNRN